MNDVTYRLVTLGARSPCGETAATPDLARLAPGALVRKGRLGIERAEWFGGRVTRKVLVDAEDRPGQWTIGV